MEGPPGGKADDRLNSEPQLLPRFRAVLLMRRASVGFPTFAFRERHEQKQYIAAPNGPRWRGLGLGRPPSWKEIGKKEEPHPCLPLCLGGNGDGGNPLILNVFFRPNRAAVAAVSALAATAGKT